MSIANPVEAVSLKLGIQISQDGAAFLKDELEGKFDVKNIEKYFFESNFRELDACLFSPGLADLGHPGKMLVQLGKVTDVSKPVGPEDEGEEDNEDGEISRTNHRFGNSRNRILKINAFAIGGTKFEFLEIEKLGDKFADNVPPGTKVMLHGPFENQSGFFLITRRDQIEVVGGRVGRLADGYDMGKRVREARQGGGVGRADGPPKFVSFLDRNTVKKVVTTKAPEMVMPTVAVLDTTIESRKVDAVVSDKSAAMGKISADAFAMRSGRSENRKGGGRHTRRREEEALVAQYRPPPIAAPQLTQFARADKCPSLVGAQLLVDNPAREDRAPPRSDRGKGQPSDVKGGSDHTEKSGHGKGTHTKYGKGRTQTSGGKGGNPKGGKGAAYKGKGSQKN